MEPQTRSYQAIVWQPQSDSVGVRVTVLANSLAEAERQLREKFGQQCIITLHNEDDAKRPRV
jgi:hypothetical protein